MVSAQNWMVLGTPLHSTYICRSFLGQSQFVGFISRMTAWLMRFEQEEGINKKLPIVNTIVVRRYISAMTPVTCCVCSHCPLPLLFSTLAPPLTVENILTAVERVAWRKLGERLIPAGDYNAESRQLEYPKLNEIAQQHQSDDSCLRAVIERWLQGEGRDEEPSWRALIRRLDGADETSAAADTIRHFAEPLPGKSCDSITFL